MTQRGKIILVERIEIFIENKIALAGSGAVLLAELAGAPRLSNHLLFYYNLRLQQ
jgi:hypothetical protein